MSATLHGLPELDSSLSSTGTPESWRWQVRRTLVELRDLLATDHSEPDDGWLAARGAGVLRERDVLLDRIARLGPRVLQDPSLEEVRAEVRRLLVDVSHHLQRRRDLAWDDVELELGGSE